jgi:hypothetical protein
MLVTVNLDSFWVGFAAGVLSLFVVLAVFAATKKPAPVVSEKKTPGKK